MEVKCDKTEKKATKSIDAKRDKQILRHLKGTGFGEMAAKIFLQKLKQSDKADDFHKNIVVPKNYNFLAKKLHEFEQSKQIE
jgi:hypothetical protein